MATRLQRLLGVAPLESLRSRASRDMQMETPINNYFGEPIQSPEVLSPLNVQSPTQGFFNTQMKTQDYKVLLMYLLLVLTKTGGDEGGTADPSGDVDPDEGSGVPTGTGMGDEPLMGSGRFLTSDADLMSNFLSRRSEEQINYQVC